MLCQLASRLEDGPWPISFTGIDIALVVVFTNLSLAIWDPGDSLVCCSATSGCWYTKLQPCEGQTLCCIFSSLCNLVLLQCERLS